jgi:hypothetical protein
MDAMPESGEKIVEKVRLHKCDNSKYTKKKMIKYYEDPEKQARLLERIKEYEDQSILYQLKANELKQYVWDKNKTQSES